MVVDAEHRGASQFLHERVRAPFAKALAANVGFAAVEIEHDLDRVVVQKVLDARRRALARSHSGRDRVDELTPPLPPGAVPAAVRNSASCRARPWRPLNRCRPVRTARRA